MSEPLPVLIENSIQIASDYLEQTGEIDDGAFTGRFLLETIELTVRKGERRKLVLSNLAITAYHQRQSKPAGTPRVLNLYAPR